MVYGNLKMWIGGEWVDAESGKTFETVNVTTGAPLGTAPLADKADVDNAVAAARRAFPVWAEKTPGQRSAVVAAIGEHIKKHAKEMAHLDALEHGLPEHIAIGPTMGAAGNFEQAAAYSRHLEGHAIPSNNDRMYSLERVPVGVCALITPWNMPFFLMAQKVALSLAAGNTCVLKVPSINAITSLKFAEILSEVEGLPKGAVNVVTGPGGTIGTYMAAHPGVDCVGFTGSTETGVSIMQAAAPTLKKLVMELGGKNPAIIFPDANLDRAVEVLAHHQFHNCGQACGSPGRYYIHESVYDKFLEKFLDHARHLTVGDPLDPKTDMGPLVSREHWGKVTGYIQSGIDEGAGLLLDGRTYDANFIGPTVFTDVTPGMKIYRDEIFGPVAVMLKWRDEDEVMALANDNTYGLTASIWTANIAHALKLGKKLTVGTFSVNSHNFIAAEAPWGGVRQSGVGGKEGGYQGVLEYTEQKMITICLIE
ncbi:phenylacetaldehyde dehydrogenase [Sporobacter termitidis DSM 10068]|uniref:3-sulfolactaldehyde dehydrogenase n=1 Tax=Sporobacter termitidis DSM 10068 TaxID=1123282 RepID=A0A1M5YKX9_9FIRM|nr:aldehyde dehydrogenase family protein [Sporobacter termitidis]SHI12652.1 phenylacetaldehyde dehydrogenase [Sporobacter termitidis DSM 10068]